MLSVIQDFFASPYGLIAIAVLGLIIGSFLNVVIYRYPKMLNAVWKAEANAFIHDQPYVAPKNTFNLCQPRSHCPQCQFEFPAWHNIPVISYLFLRGRCAKCKQRISFRYPLTECLTMLASVVAVFVLGSSLYALAVLILTWFLIAQSFIDAEHKFIPDTMSYCMLWLGLLVSISAYGPITASSSILGATFGYLILWLVAKAFLVLRKKDGMGHGDFKLLAMLGAWTGPLQLPFILIIASVLSLICSIIWLCRKSMQTDTPIPFGPFLAIGGWVCILWGSDIIRGLALFWS